MVSPVAIFLRALTLFPERLKRRSEKETGEIF